MRSGAGNAWTGHRSTGTSTRPRHRRRSATPPWYSAFTVPASATPSTSSKAEANSTTVPITTRFLLLSFLKLPAMFLLPSAPSTLLPRTWPGLGATARSSATGIPAGERHTSPGYHQRRSLSTNKLGWSEMRPLAVFLLVFTRQRLQRSRALVVCVLAPASAFCYDEGLTPGFSCGVRYRHNCRLMANAGESW